MEKWKLLLIVSGATFCFIMIFGIISFPFIFKAIVRDQTSLRKRNLVREYYLKIPIALDFRVYFFNITNPDEVQQGSIPILKEVGPYCYDSYKEKVNVSDDKEMDTLTYNPFETYFFNASRSGSLTPDDHVTILNPLVMGIINSVIRTNAAFLTTVSKAVKFLFNDPKSIYVSVKVRDILFDGVLINCTSKDFAARAVCSQLKTQLTTLVEKEKNVFLFSIFGPRNGSIPTRYMIKRGIKSSRDLGHLISIDGKTEQSLWSTNECNQYRGTDGWIFPPFQSNEEGLWTHSHEICRLHLITLGMPVIANKRLQFNLMVQPVKKVPFMATLPEALHPIFWIEEGIMLEGDLLKQITQVFIMLKVVKVASYLFLTASIVGLITGGVLWNQERNRKVIPVKRQSAGSGDTISISREVISKLESKLYKNQPK